MLKANTECRKETVVRNLSKELGFTQLAYYSNLYRIAIGIDKNRMLPGCMQNFHEAIKYLSGSICSKHRLLNGLVSSQNDNCSSKYNTYLIGIFAEKLCVAFAMQMQKLLTFFQQKY